MSWNRVVEKFHCLSGAFADEDLRNRLIQAELDTRRISDLVGVLPKFDGPWSIRKRTAGFSDCYGQEATHERGTR
jgi:hypothetical protein